MKYKIAYRNPSQKYIPVEAYFDCSDRNEIELQFPGWRPGRYEMGNFAKNIKNFAVLNTDNKAIPFKKISQDKWIVDCSTTEAIKVFYYYYANELNAGSTFIDDQQIYVNPVNCLVYIKGRANDPCELILDIPTNFKVATGARVEDNIILAESYHELVDSPFIASADMLHLTYSVLGIDFHLWFQGKAEINEERVIEDFKKFTLSQIEKFSNRRLKTVGFPVKTYHFLFQILPIKAYHGVEHQTGTVIALGPTNDLMTSLYDDFLGVSSHELYHTWNVKAIRPIEMYPYDYSQPNYSPLGYVAEGVTTYMGDVFLALSGVKPFSWYKVELEKLLAKHFANFARFNYSVAESSWDTWLDGYVQGAPARKVSIYNEGALLAFAMDMKIRKNSQNKFSLHDVMHKLYLDFALNNKGYSEDDYKAACETFAEEDLSDFFNNYVQGTSPYESILTEALETIGFTLEMKDNPNGAERILGIKSNVVLNKTLITDIYPGSGGEMANLSLNDEVIAVNELTVNGNFEQLIAMFEERNITITVNRGGRLLDLNCPNTNRNFYPIYFIKPVKIPSNLSKRIFKSWIGYNWEEVI